MLDLEGTSLSAEEKEILQHPLVGAVIYFTRNFESKDQIKALTDEIHSVRDSKILVCVDHEGGRVQRFRTDFTRLPACRKLGDIYDENSEKGLSAAKEMGWLMAAELRAVGIDFSFAPVLDIDYGISGVIGDRAFHKKPALITKLAGAYMEGMRDAGMSTTGKHFPGHGGVQADSHVDLPIDNRTLEEIIETDIVPFDELNKKSLLDAIMPAHVIYENVAKEPAGFSHYWVNDILRNRLEFDGAIFSDDLNMAAANVAGDYVARAEAALSAGCDMAIVCNNRAGAIQILDGFKWNISADALRRLENMRGKTQMAWKDLTNSPRWDKANELAQQLSS